MRSVLCVVILLVLAGCSGAAQPTPTATLAPTAGTTAEGVPTANNPQVQLAATINAPIPGTIVHSSTGQTPNAPTQSPIPFDTLSFTQTGGIAKISLTITLNRDGTLVRDGKTSTVTPDQVKQISDLLNQMDFFHLNGQFVSIGGSADSYRYTLTVTSGGDSNTIVSDDSLTPPQLFTLYNAIRALNNS